MNMLGFFRNHEIPTTFLLPSRFCSLHRDWINTSPLNRSRNVSISPSFRNTIRVNIVVCKYTNNIMTHKESIRESATELRAIAYPLINNLLFIRKNSPIKRRNEILNFIMHIPFYHISSTQKVCQTITAAKCLLEFHIQSLFPMMFKA
jgi:hypothetical protein